MTTRKTSTGECDACRRIIGLWQAVFTSECGHTFHRGCVSGAAACPVCAARWSDTPATAPADAPATPFNFASTTDSSSASRRPLFGQPSIAHNSYFTFAWPPPSPPSPSTASQHPVFDDDEPVEPPSPLDQVQEAPTNKDGVVVLKTHCEHPAVARDTA